MYAIYDVFSDSYASARNGGWSTYGDDTILFYHPGAAADWAAVHGLSGVDVVPVG